jgi:adenosylcobinamide kinase/adenosylcobinamide-phosphate guanylyltransferase
MSTGRIIVIGGGVRCGKSAFALELARSLGTRRLFIATAEALDAEMRERIERHRSERGQDFETLEVPLAVPEALERAQTDVVVVDCLTFWLSNLLLRDATDAQIEARVAALLHSLSARRFHSILVTNEVGMGVVPDNALGRRFRDCVGHAHQQLAALSDELYFGVLGSMLRLRPAPIALQTQGSTEDIHATHR